MPIRPPTKNAGAGTGGGGGGGTAGAAFSLGPEQNEFNNNNARNVYEAANATWLAEYNENKSFLIAVGTTTIEYQRRNVAETDWEVVSAVIRGADGDDGADGTDGADGADGTDGADGADGTTVTANPGGTDGDDLNRLAIAGVNYNIAGSGMGGGMATSWERRIVPSITIAGARPDAIDGALATNGIFTVGGGSNVRDAFVQFEFPDSLRAAVTAGLLGVSFRFGYRFAARSGTLSSVLNISLIDADGTRLADAGNHVIDGNGGLGSDIVSLPSGTTVASTGNAFIRVNWINSTFNDNIGFGSLTLEATIQDTTGAPGLSSVEPDDLEGISRGSLQGGHLIATGASDIDVFQTIDPATLGGSGAFDLWADVTVIRNAIADTDRLVVAWSQGSGQPNRAVTFGTLKNELRWPTITQFNVVGTSRVATGTDISGDIYRYSTQIAQAGHASAVRIIGYTGNNVANPATTETVLATLASSVYAHASGQVAIPAGTTLTNAGDAYNLRLEAYEQGQTVGTSIPVAYHDYRIIAQADSALTHFGFVLSTEAAADINFTQDDISTQHGVAGTWTVSGLPMAGLQRLYWAVPTSEAQPSNWEQGGTTIAPTIEAAVTRTINSVEYQIYLFAAANAVGNVYNGTTITVTA